MNKKLGLIIAAAVLFVLGLIGFLLVNKSSKTAPINAGTTPEPSPSAQKMSLRSLLSFSGSQICNFSDTASTTSGQIHMSAGRVRGDFSTVAGGNNIKSHMYTDGREMYIWMDGSASGFKSSLTVTPSPEANKPANENVDLDRQSDFECGPWTPDDSLFVLPDTVKFSDLSTLMAVPTGGQASPCQACDRLTGDTATQCKKALNCP